MARKPSNADKEQAEIKPTEETVDRTKGGMVEAVLKTRHCRGGLCKEKGETMPMTRGEYERLKKFGRVE